MMPPRGGSSRPSVREFRVSLGEFVGRTIGQLNNEELRRLAASRGRTEEARCARLAARAQLAVSEFEESLPATAAAPDTEVPTCTVLALVPRPAQPQAARAAPRRAQFGFALGNVGVWRWAAALILFVLAFPAAAKVPAFLFGWLVRFTFARITEVCTTFASTFTAVIGDLAAEAIAIAVPSDPSRWNGGSILLSIAAFLMLRRQ